MKILPVNQGDEAWHELHRARLTSTRFKTVLHGGPRAWKSLMRSMHTSQRKQDVVAASLEWGYEHEPLARAEYEFLTRAKVRQVGFVVGDDPRFGVSPDGLVGKDGVVEIKCPYDALVHQRTVVSQKLPIEHRPQVQGMLCITKRRWCDFISFDPRREDHDRLVVIRVLRDDRYIERLRVQCEAFLKLYAANQDPTRGKLKHVPQLF